MAKISQEKLAKLRKHDKAAFDFANDAVASFFTRAAEEGYSLDTTGFLAHPGFFQAPYRREASEDIDIAMVGCPLDLGAIGLAGARHGPKALREGSRNYGPINDVTGAIPFEQCNVVDYGDVEWSKTDLETRVSQDIANTFELLGGAGIASCRERV